MIRAETLRYMEPMIFLLINRVYKTNCAYRRIVLVDQK
jgi:hypothetical protein